MEQGEPAPKKRRGPPPGTARKPRQPKKAAADASGSGGGGGASADAGAKKPRKPRAEADLDDLLVGMDDGKGVEEEADEALGNQHSGLFAKDLPWLMYGYGDADKPLEETVNLVEDIALQFITDTVHAAMRAAAVRTGGAMCAVAGKKEELKLGDVLYAVRRDPRKVARVQELVHNQEQITSARRALKEEEVPGLE